MLTIVTTQRLGPEATRAEADRLAAFTVAGEPPGTITARVVEGEPVVLAGLVRGGEYASVAEWEAGDEDLCVDANGRIASNAAVRAGTAPWPITWHRYPKEG